MLSNEIPTFLHIPKNSGTYAIGVIDKLYRQNCLYNIMPYCASNVAHRILIKDNDNHTCFTAFLYDYSMSLLNDPKVNIDEMYSIPKMRIEDFKTLCLNKKQSLEIFSLVIEDYGIRYLKTDFLKILESIFNRSIVYFTVLREDFFRQQSLYNYICSINSVHESTHGAIRSKTFEEYLASDECDCCWLVRALSGNQYNELTDNDFDNACKILDSFIIDKHTNIINLIDNIFNQCYGITTNDIGDLSNVYQHKTQYTKIFKEDIDPKILEHFLNRSKYENLLYTKYIG